MKQKSLFSEEQFAIGVTEIVAGTGMFIVGLPLCRGFGSALVDCGVGAYLIYDGANQIDMVLTRRRNEAYATEMKEINLNSETLANEIDNRFQN